MLLTSEQTARFSLFGLETKKIFFYRVERSFFVLGLGLGFFVMVVVGFFWWDIVCAHLWAFLELFFVWGLLLVCGFFFLVSSSILLTAQDHLCF